MFGTQGESMEESELSFSIFEPTRASPKNDIGNMKKATVLKKKDS